jgi:nitrite reductase (NADH) large subunit
MTQDIIIIGGGAAAFNAIKSIRETDSSSDIHLIQNEPVYPYFRTRLTKSLFEDLDADKIALQRKEWYEQNNVTIHLGKEVTSVDVKSNKVFLNDGSSLEYSKLLLANGAINNKPNIEGIDKDNVFTIRKFEDIQAIKTKSQNLKTVLHLGGGIQNLEAAWAFCSHGKDVIIVEFMDRLMPRQLDIRASEILLNAVKAQNVKVYLSTEVLAIKGDDKVSSVIARSRNASEGSEQSLTCDMVIYSVGIRPNKKIYENTDIQTNIGVIVDDHMHTNIDNIYAAGDITEYCGRVGGLWTIAIEQGKTSGYNIVGKDVSYTGILPVTTINAFDLNIFSVGTVDEANATLTLVDDPGDGKSYKRIFIKDNTIAGAIVIGDSKHNNILKKYVADNISILDIDFSDITVNDLLERLSSK